MEISFFMVFYLLILYSRVFCVFLCCILFNFVLLYGFMICRVEDILSLKFYYLCNLIFKIKIKRIFIYEFKIKKFLYGIL